MSLAKAYILPLEGREKNNKVACLFNPKEYTFSKQNNWQRTNQSKTDAPSLEFSGGQPTSLKIQLLFDTYHKAKGVGSVEDVRVHTGRLWGLMLIDPELKDPKSKSGRPPKVRFMWGQTWTFDAVISSISQQFTMFMPDGLPVRATLDVSFEQLRDENQLKAQNPSSGGIGGERLWTVRDGDSLERIAFETLGDATQWRQIADANRLTSIRRLAPGQVLVIPVD
jgi:Contractile injection system tube protein/LysM domain